MARKYANFFTAIWREPDWRVLSGNAQRVYMLLSSQPDITAAGTLPLTVKRWAAMASDSTTESIVAGLRELQDNRKVVYDTQSEELLVRTFVKWDGGYGNEKRRPVILAAAAEVESAAIRRALAAEFERLGLPSQGLSDAHADSLSAAQSGGLPLEPSEVEKRATQQVLDGSLSSQGNSLSDTPSDATSPSDRVVVTKGPYVDTSTHNPQSTTRNPSAADAAALPIDVPEPEIAPETDNQRANRLAKTYTDKRNLSNFPAVAKIVAKAMKDGHSDDAITAALARLVSDDLTVTTNTLHIAISQGAKQPNGNGRSRNTNTPYQATPRHPRTTNYAAELGLNGSQP